MKWRDLFSKIHLYLGLASAGLLILVSVTGSIIVFEEELDRFLHPAFFEIDAEARAAGETIPHSRAVELVESAREGIEPLSIDFRHEPDGPWIINATDHNASGAAGSRREFSIDPYAGRLIAERSGLNLVSVIWQLHVDLLMGSIGGTIVGVSAIIMIVSIITGLVLWWPKRGKVKQAFTIKRNASAHRLNIDIHRVTGIYLLVPLLVASITGVIITWPQYTFPAIEPFLEIPEYPQPEAREIDPDLDIGVDAVEPIAREHIPTGQLRTLHLPTQFDFYLASIRSFENGHPRGRSYVYIYPDTGEVHHWTETRGNTLGYQIRWEWLLPTHSGDILGFPGRIAILLAGLTPLVFTITGVAIWWKKRKGRLKRKRRSPAPIDDQSAEDTSATRHAAE